MDYFDDFSSFVDRNIPETSKFYAQNQSSGCKSIKIKIVKIENELVTPNYREPPPGSPIPSPVKKNNRTTRSKIETPEDLDAIKSFVYYEEESKLFKKGESLLGHKAQKTLRRVPVVNIYGILLEDKDTEHRDKPRTNIDGLRKSKFNTKKVCVHLHQIYPYIYVRYDSNVENGNFGASDIEPVFIYARKLAININKALLLALNAENGSSYNTEEQFVMAVVPVWATPFYGYHGHDSNTCGISGSKRHICNKKCGIFLKIYMLDPRLMPLLNQLLQSGAIMGREFDVFGFTSNSVTSGEDNLPLNWSITRKEASAISLSGCEWFTAQFMIDYGLVGMGIMELSTSMKRNNLYDHRPVTFRRGILPKRKPTESPLENILKIQEESDLEILDYEKLTNLFPRTTKTSIEIDCLPWAILNRHEIIERSIPSCKSNNIVEVRKSGDIDNYLVPSVRVLWEHEAQLLQSSGSSDSINKLQHILVSKSQNFGLNEKIHQNLPFMTLFQSVTALYPHDVLIDNSQGHVNTLQLESLSSDIGTPVSESILAELSKRDKYFESISSIPDDDPQNLAAHQSFHDMSSQLARSSHDHFQNLADSEIYNNIDIDENIVRTQRIKFDDAHKEARRIGSQPEDILLSESGDEEHSEEEDEGNDDEFVDILRMMAEKPLNSENLMDIDEDSIKSSPNVAFENSSPIPSQEMVEISSELSMYTSKAAARVQSIIKQPDKDDLFPSICRMWSPTDISRELERPMFFYSPPRPTSPEDDPEAYSPLEPNYYSHDLSFEELSQKYKSSEAVKILKAKMWRRISGSSWLTPMLLTPTKIWVEENSEKIICLQYRDPYFKDLKDLPERDTNFMGRGTSKIRTGVLKFPSLEDLFSTSSKVSNQASQSCGVLITPEKHLKNEEKGYFFSPTVCAPTRNQIIDFYSRKTKKVGTNIAKVRKNVSQIDGPSLKDENDFKFSIDSSNNDQRAQCEYITLMTSEVHANGKGEKLADPMKDSVNLIVFSVYEDNDIFDDAGSKKYHTGVIITKDENSNFPKLGVENCEIDEVEDEFNLFLLLIDRVTEFDPDILLGYEIQNHSWGYLIERARFRFNLDLCRLLSKKITSMTKLSEKQSSSHSSPSKLSWGYKKSSSISISGRIVLNVWRLLKSELALTSYSIQNIVYHVLHHRFPHFSQKSLTQWYIKKNGFFRWRVVHYYIQKCHKTFEILDSLNVIGRTSEFSKVFGVEFFSVINRGSQFHVESMMHRIARPESYIMISPTKDKLRNMRATESLPLVMEPESGFYKSPLVVLDFQSLYPSIIIAHNYCYSTCLGKISPYHSEKLGFTNYSVREDFFRKNANDITVSPNGVAFLKPQAREGILGRMLYELLDTRVMVKNSMKRYKDCKRLHRTLDSRQLSLKYISNVTYGYTAASFSGRMPSPEIADSVVAKGRETLENTIKYINEHPTWNARVVYADTDSCFIYMEGSSRARAFKVGKEIADTITELNPKPVKLKFEKVYHPCVLVSKKRYVGFKYEHPDQKEPAFDAKGIETVRRDGCPAVSKILEASLKILFRSQDMSKLKSYLTLQWEKIMSERVSLKDFIFAKAVKLGTYSEKGIPPPGAFISLEKMKNDIRSEPQYGERVPYVIAYSGPKARLVDCAKSPTDFMEQSCRLHGEYYISKQIIPVLSRIFDLIGVNILEWYQAMPKVHRLIKLAGETYSRNASPLRKGQRNILEHYYRPKHCLNCSKVSTNPLCDQCNKKPFSTVLEVLMKIRSHQASHAELIEICRNCCSHQGGQDAGLQCESVDCPIFFERFKKTKSHQKIASSEDFIYSYSLDI